MAIVDHRKAVGLRKLGSPIGFEFYRWEVISGDSTLLTGCVVTRTYSKGPRKGRPVYDGQAMKAVVTEDEEQAECVRYESETGQCGTCGGDGKEFDGWNHNTGTKWRECRRCSGTGKK
jgi:hypothetical protein